MRGSAKEPEEMTGRRAPRKAGKKPRLESIEMSESFPVEPKTIFVAWMDSKMHGEFTGSPADIGAKEGSRFSAWDGYITGKTIMLEPYKRIVQTWRATEFPEGSGDSRLELEFEEIKGGTRLTLKHTLIPEGQAAQYKEGWKEFYFEPMKRYFKRAKRR